LLLAVPDRDGDENDHDREDGEDALGPEPIAYLESMIQPYEATMKQHSMMLRDMKMGEAPNLNKGRFISNEERWLHKYDTLVRFHERYGYTFMSLSGRRATDVHDDMLFDDDIDDYYSSVDAGNFTLEDEDEGSLTLYVDDEFTEPYSRIQLG